MDNIEVRVEELISKHARDLDKEETERIKWMKSEAEYFNKTNPSSGSGGGFFDQIIKAITGGGKGGGMMGAGVAGGMAAVGIMALVDILKDAVSNSKILTTVLGTIGKALGLLIDVILLPFLPILITGIIWLYQGIMQFYKLWNGIWSSKAMQLIGSGLATVGGILAKGISAFFNVQFGLLGSGAAIIWKVLTWLWGIVTGGGILSLSLAFILGPVGVLLDWIYDVATGKTTIKATINFLLGTVGDILTWLYNAVTSGIKISLDFVSNLASSAGLGGVSSAVNDVESAISNPIGWVGGAINTVESAASSAAAAVTNVFNFPNYVGSKADITKAVNDANRQQQYRTNV